MLMITDDPHSTYVLRLPKLQPTTSRFVVCGVEHHSVYIHSYRDVGWFTVCCCTLIVGQKRFERNWMGEARRLTLRP